MCAIIKSWLVGGHGGEISAVTLLQVTQASVTRGDFPLTTTLRAACPLAQGITTLLSARKCLALTHVKF